MSSVPSKPVVPSSKSSPKIVPKKGLPPPVATAVKTPKTPTTPSTSSASPGSRPTSASKPISKSPVAPSAKTVTPTSAKPKTPTTATGAKPSAPTPKTPLSGKRPMSGTKPKESKEETKTVLAAAKPKDPIRTDVVVIGGGFSGVSTAMNLWEKYGVTNTVVIDAKGRLGGRNFSYQAVVNGKLTPFFFEHGAQYVGVDQQKLDALWQRVGNPKEEKIDGYDIRKQYRQQVMLLNHKIYSYDRDDVSLKIGGVPPGLQFFDLMAVLLMVQEILTVETSINVLTPWSDASKYNPKLADVRALDFLTMGQYLNLAPIDPSVGINRDWVTNTSAALIVVACQAVLSVEASEMSTLFFLWYCATDNGFLNVVNDEKDGPQQYYHKYGFNRLLQDWFKPMAQQSKLVQNKVTQINATNKHAVQVTCADGQVYVAKQVVVAVTPRAIYNTLKFDPPLSDAQQLVTNQLMGRTIKCQIFYKTQWWNDSMALSYTGYAGAVSYPVTWIMDYSPASSDPTVASQPGACCLMTFTVGQQADLLYENGKRPDKTTIAKLVTQGIATLFNDIRALWTSEEYLDIIYHEWIPESDGGDPCLPGGPNTVLPLGGLFSGDPNNPEGPAASFLQYETINDSVVFCCAEFAKKIDASMPDGWPQIDPDTGLATKFSDAREALGYMDGAIGAGEAAAQIVAAQLEAKEVTSEETKVTPTAPQPSHRVSAPLTATLIADSKEIMNRVKSFRDSVGKRLISLGTRLKDLAERKKTPEAEVKTTENADPAPPSYTKDQLFQFLTAFINSVGSEAQSNFPKPNQSETDWWANLGNVVIFSWILGYIISSMSAAGMEIDMNNMGPYLEALIIVGKQYTFSTITTGLKPDGTPITKPNPDYDPVMSQLAEALNTLIAARLAVAKAVVGPQ